MRVALAQMNSGVSPENNFEKIRGFLTEAASQHADLMTCPEMALLLDKDKKRLSGHWDVQACDQYLQRLEELVDALNITLHLGSVPVPAGGKFYNRSFWIRPGAGCVAQYDKIHRFDVDLGEESHRESNTYLPGQKAVVVDEAGFRFGLTICFDMRFSHLYRGLARRGAHVFMVPAAFTRPTGKAHWEVMLRSRAIEHGSYVVACGQTGEHEDGRATWGHSMVVGPWGEVILDMGEEEGLGFATLDMGQVQQARQKVPTLRLARSFD